MIINSDKIKELVKNSEIDVLKSLIAEGEIVVDRT